MRDAATLLSSSLADLAPRLAAESAPGRVTLAELPIAGQLDLRGDPADPAFLAGVSAALGFPFPHEPNRVTALGSVSALWLGPDEWLLVMPLVRLAELEAGLTGALRGLHVALTEVSANRTRLALQGPKAREVLAKGCGLDLDARAFRPGHCAQTTLARALVILEQVDDAPTYHLHVRPSFAAYLAAWLLDAMAEYRLAPTR